jgi:hypothetical protein
MPAEPSFGEEISMPATNESKPTTPSPIIVDLGKKRRKDVRRLRRGQGKLFDQVNTTIQELKTAGTISSHAEPVILVVRQKRGGGKNSWMPRL